MIMSFLTTVDMWRANLFHDQGCGVGVGVDELELAKKKEENKNSEITFFKNVNNINFLY